MMTYVFSFGGTIPLRHVYRYTPI